MWGIVHDGWRRPDRGSLSVGPPRGDSGERRDMAGVDRWWDPRRDRSRVSIRLAGRVQWNRRLVCEGQELRRMCWCRVWEECGRGRD